MKTIGLIGGMSWESSLEYYRIINERIKQSLGGLHSAKCLMYSMDFHEVETQMNKNRWESVTRLILAAAQKLEEAGADCLVICTNTIHKVADDIEVSISIPLLHIADATGTSILQRGLKKVGLLGTRFTMEEEFYRQRLKEKYLLDVIIPTESERNIIHNFIFKELCLGIMNETTRKTFQEIMKSLSKRGAEGIILGCTELPLIIQEEDSTVHLFDSMDLHARYAVNFSLGKK